MARSGLNWTQSAVRFKKFTQSWQPPHPPAASCANCSTGLQLDERIDLPKGSRTVGCLRPAGLAALGEVTTRNSVAEKPDLRAIPWAPELRFLAATRVFVPLADLLKLQDFFARGGRERPSVPIKERSLETFGDEKRLDAFGARLGLVRPTAGSHPKSFVALSSPSRCRGPPGLIQTGRSSSSKMRRRGTPTAAGTWSESFSVPSSMVAAIALWTAIRFIERQSSPRSVAPAPCCIFWRSRSPGPAHSAGSIRLRTSRRPARCRAASLELPPVVDAGCGARPAVGRRATIRHPLRLAGRVGRTSSSALCRWASGSPRSMSAGSFSRDSGVRWSKR